MSGNLDSIFSFLHITMQTYRWNHVHAIDCTCWSFRQLAVPTHTCSLVDRSPRSCLPHRSVGRSMTNVPESIPPAWPWLTTWSDLHGSPPAPRFLDPFPEISLALTDRGRFADVNQGLNYWCAVISWPFWGWFVVRRGMIGSFGDEVEN